MTIDNKFDEIEIKRLASLVIGAKVYDTRNERYIELNRTPLQRGWKREYKTEYKTEYNCDCYSCQCDGGCDCVCQSNCCDAGPCYDGTA